MYRIYIRRMNDASGHVFKSKFSVKDDKIAILPHLFVAKNFITEEEWAKSQQNIREKLGLYISETVIDGRTKLARSMKHFTWVDIFNMKKNRSGFKAMGYCAVNNSTALVIEISNCGSMVRYRMEDCTGEIDDWHCPVSDWQEIHFDEAGEPYFTAYNSKRYLSEFAKL